MDCIDLIRRLHEHRRWVNAMLMDKARTLDEGQLHRTFEIGQGTIWLTLTHLYGAEYIWLEALTGNEDPLAPGDVRGRLPGNQDGDDAMTGLEELASNWSELEGRWRDYLADLTPSSLVQLVAKINSLSGVKTSTKRIDVLLHVCTHAQYTTAQVINMMRHVGVTDLPDPMLITLARQQQG